MDRKEQIVSAAIDRLHAVGFEGFRLGDVAKDVGINNATLVHHFPSKDALIKAVVERFTKRFEAVADDDDGAGSPREKLARHMQSSMDLMSASADMFVVLNEIMTKAHRDPEISQLVAVPLAAWREHIVGLLTSSTSGNIAVTGQRAQEVATACMAQLLGVGLLLASTADGRAALEAAREPGGHLGIIALSSIVEDAR